MLGGGFALASGVKVRQNLLNMSDEFLIATHLRLISSKSLKWRRSAAQLFQESGLSHDIGAIMRNLEIFNHNVIMLICIIISVTLTNVCSNTVIASIFIPIVAELAR